MEIYQKLLKQKQAGEKIELSNLTKEDLYFIYIEEGHLVKDIANLFNTSQNEINKLRNKWNIKVTQEFMTDRETMKYVYEKFGSGYEYDYHLYLLKEHMGLPTFEDLFIPFLTILKDRKVHNIQEFWHLTDKNYKISEAELQYCVSYENPTLFYRADWCLEAMLKANLVEEIAFREYKITKQGEKFLEDCIKEKINQFGLGYLLKKCSDSNLSLSNNVEEEIQQKIENEENIVSSKVQATKEEQEKTIKEQVSNLKQIDSIENITKKKSSNKSTNKSKAVKTNFTKINEIKTDFGKKCERIIYEHEKERLRQEGQAEKAEQVIWASEEKGDGLGYDIESFEKVNGKYEKIYIEVKGTDKDCLEPFDVSINEVMVSEQLKGSYYIYRIAKANTKQPIFYKVKGSIAEKFDLTAIKFRASRRSK